MPVIDSLSLGLNVALSPWKKGLKEAEGSVAKFSSAVNDRVRRVDASLDPARGKVDQLGRHFREAGSSLDKAFRSGGIAGLRSAVGPVAGSLGGAAKAALGLGLNLAKPAAILAGGLGPVAAGAIGAIGTGLTAATGAVAGLAAGAAVVGTAFAGVALAGSVALGAMAAGGLDRIDQLGDQAQTLGVTTEALSELRYAANLTGSSAENLDAALEKLNANLGDVSDKATPTSTALKRLGLDAKQVAGQTADVTFRQIVDGFGKIPNAAEKASLAMDLFGKGGVKILNTLSAGAPELERLSAEARKLGVSVNQVDQAKVAAAKDSLDRAGASIEGIGNTLAIRLAPYIEAAGNMFTDLVGHVWDYSGTFDKATKRMGVGVAWLIDAGAGLAPPFLRSLAAIGDGFAVAARSAGSFATLMQGVSPAYGAVAAAANVTADAIELGTGKLRGVADATAGIKPGTALLKGLESLQAKAKKAAEEVAENVRKGLEAKPVSSHLTEEIEAVIKKLKEEVATAKMTTEEAEVYKLKEKGATEAQLAEAKSLAERKKALDAEKKTEDEFDNWVKTTKEKSINDAEKYRKELDKIDKAQAAGKLTKDEADKARKVAGKEAHQAGEYKSVGSDRLGSEAGYSAIVAGFNGKADGMKEVARSSSRTADNTAVIVRLLSGQAARPDRMAEFAI